jgi:NADH-quinone oxidoreductase subunit E
MKERSSAACDTKSSSSLFINEVIDRYKGRAGSLLGILESVQRATPNKYLSKDALRYIAEKTNIPTSRVYSVASFFALFNLQPQGEHIISLCRGTACHTRGSRDLVESVESKLGLSGGTDDSSTQCKTTGDKKFTVRTVACFGQCAMAPVVEVDSHICGRVNERALLNTVRSLANSGNEQVSND